MESRPARWLSRSSRCLLVQFIQQVEQLSGVGQSARLIFPPVAYHSALVDYQHCAAAHATLWVPQFVGLGHLAMGMPVGKLWEGYATEGGAPCPVGIYVVAANAQHLGILLLDPGVVKPEQGCLLRSTSGEVENVKGEDHMLLPGILAQRNLSMIRGGHLEVRGFVTYLCGHVPAHLSIGFRSLAVGLSDYTPRSMGTLGDPAKGTG